MNRTIRIVVLDDDPVSYQVVQHCFLYEMVDVLWFKSSEELISLQQPIDVVLYSISETNDYENAARILVKHPKTILFILSKINDYDAFEARNAGAIGAFIKPLSAGVIQTRLEELLPGLARPSIDDVFVPTVRGPQSHLVSFTPISPIQTDLESLVEELLPVVVEQVIRVQISSSTPFRNLLRDEIHQVVMESVHELNKKKSN